MTMGDSLQEFESLVVEALDGLPGEFLGALDNVEIVVEDEPTPGQLHRAGVRSGTLLGLYEGIPKTARNSGYGFVLPDKISIFRGPISRHAAGPDDVRWMVRHTVMHELAHHFGISDQRLREIGRY